MSRSSPTLLVLALLLSAACGASGTRTAAPSPSAAPSTSSPTPATTTAAPSTPTPVRAPSPTVSATTTSRPTRLVALYTCENRTVVEPRSYVLACGDGNAWLDALRWTSWTASRATANGTYHVNDCTPYCAAGHFHTSPASVVVDRATRTPRGLLFARLTATFSGTLPNGQRTLVDDALLPYAWTHPSASSAG